MFRLKVKEIALAQGFTQGKLSRLADVEVRTIRRIFRHPTQSVTLATLDRIAKTLDVNIQDLVETVPDDYQEPASEEGEDEEEQHIDSNIT